MPAITLIIGNKNYSSWSLRAWLALKQTDVPFDEVLIPLDQPDSKAAILAHSPAGQVPILKVNGELIWETLAIIEYLAETCPDAGLWPTDPAARAQARAVSAEMHAGFAPLRTHMPMDLRGAYPGQGRGPGVEADVARIVKIWTQCRARFGAGGDFLFGAFGAADAMFAPVVGRLRTFGVDLPEVCAAYRDAVWAHPSMAEWVAAAVAEPWVIDEPTISTGES